MEVKSSYGEDSHHDTKKSDSEKGGLEGSLGFGAMSAKVTGSVSYSNADTSSFDSHYQKSNQAKYTLALHAKQLPLPQGVTTIIKFFSNAIEPAAMPKSTAHTQGHQSSDSTYSI